MMQASRSLSRYRAGALAFRPATPHEVIAMSSISRARLFTIASICIAALAAARAGAQAPPAPGSKTWIGHAAEMEEYLKSASVVGMEELKVGVTRPRRAKLAPGGPVDAFSWKPIRPGRYNGYWESYKSEIAAYELDKLLALNMVPPTVERQVQGDVGAAVMWVSPTKSFKDLGGVPGQAGIAGPPPAQFASWTRQLTRAKMFDDFIGNTDPNLGNWLVDPSWNLVLIDHSRAFTPTKKLYHALTQVDGELWDKMKALDEASLTSGLSAWLDKEMIRGMLTRRDLMQQEINKLKK